MYKVREYNTSGERAEKANMTRTFIQIFLLFVGLHLILASSSPTISIPKDQHLRKTSKPDDTGDDISREKKKNIPLVPKPNEGVTGLTSLKYSGGKHPVLHEFVSDHPTTEELVGTKKDTVMQPPATNYVDPYASFIQPTDEGGVADATGLISHKPSKRFELYPKWFSNKVPSIFGKRFSKNYYYPFDGSSGGGVVKSRNTIAQSPHGRHMRVAAAAGSRLRSAHSLPMSYMQQGMPAPIHIQAGGGIGMGLVGRRRPHTGAVAMMPIGVPAEIYGGGAANPDIAASPYAGNVLGGGVYGGPNQFGAPGLGTGLGAPVGVMDLPDDAGMIGNGYSSYGGPGYPMRQVPHGLMQRMNPDMYQPMSG